MEFESSSYQISIAQSLEDVSSLNQEWDELHQRCSCQTLYNSFDFVYTSIKHFSVKSDQLLFVCVRNKDDGILQAIFPFSISDYYWRMGRFRCVLLAGREESDKAYPIIDKQSEEKIWPEILDFLKSQNNQWQFLDFEEIRENSHILSVLENSFNKGYLVHSNPDAVSPIIDLSDNWQEFWSKHRKMRKRVRKVESSFADEFRFEIIDQQSSVMQALEDYIELERSSWKLKAKVGIGKDRKTIAFYQEYFKVLAEKNQLAFAFMYKGEQLVSGEIAYTHGDTVYFSHGCYNSQFSNLSPGMVSTCLFLKHYFGKSFRKGDFLGGFAQYINPWASQLMPSKNLIVIRVGFKTILFYVLDLLRRVFIKPIKSRFSKWLGLSKETKRN